MVAGWRVEAGGMGGRLEGSVLMVGCAHHADAGRGCP